MKIQIYLSGKKEECRYRDYVKKNYSFLNLFDPIEEVDSKIDSYEQIVINDKISIENSDLLVAYIRELSFGTIMEIHHAWNFQIPVYVINPGKEYVDDVWLKYHTTRFFDNINECFDYIKYDMIKHLN